MDQAGFNPFIFRLNNKMALNIEKEGDIPSAILQLEYFKNAEGKVL